MHKWLYIFIIFFFIVFLSILIYFEVPNGPGNARISGYFTIPPEDKHYIQVPEGTNITARIIIDNTPVTAYDLINYTLKIYVKLDIKNAADIPITARIWENNFTLYRNEVRTIEIYNITASSHGYDINGIFIFSEWEYYGQDIGSFRLDIGMDVKPIDTLMLGSPIYQEPTFFTFTNIMILIGAIGMGIMLFILLATARYDIQAHRRRKHAPHVPKPEPPASVPPPTLPSGHLEEPATTAPMIPETQPLPSGPAEHPPIETITLIPCPQCGSKIDKHQVICPNCGHEFQKCVVCNLIIEEDEETDSCPECGALGHRDHFREWIHVNGKCPICKAILSS